MEELSRTFAKHFTGGAFAALRVITAADKSAGYERDMDLPGLMAILREQGEAVNAGNLAQAEAMLMNQATALQTVFARLVERGMGCTEIAPFEANLRMGLRAQSQCRATLETLAAIKNPSSVAFVRQANIAHGPQQVNNGRRRPRAREKTKSRQTNFWRRTMANGWTPERRARQAELIRNWKPWERSTGPRTPEGKARTSRNADKGDTRGMLRELLRALREQDETRKRAIEYDQVRPIAAGRPALPLVTT